MKFEEALAAMREGKKVRLSGWLENSYIFLRKDFFVEENGSGYEIPNSQILDEDWEIYEEKLEKCKHGNFHKKYYLGARHTCCDCLMDEIAKEEEKTLESRINALDEDFEKKFSDIECVQKSINSAYSHLWTDLKDFKHETFKALSKFHKRLDDLETKEK